MSKNEPIRLSPDPNCELCGGSGTLSGGEKVCTCLTSIKTYMVYDCEYHGVQYLILEGDFSRFQGIYINAGRNENSNLTVEEYDNLATELSRWMHDKEGEIAHKSWPLEQWLHEFGNAFGKATFHVVECGYIE